MQSFNVQIADKFGLKEAVIINYLQYEIGIYQKSNKNFYEEKHWVNDLKDKLLIAQPFFINKSRVNRVINRLLRKNVIVRKRFRSHPFQSSYSYAFEDENLFLPRYNENFKKEMKYD